MKKKVFFIALTLTIIIGLIAVSWPAQEKTVETVVVERGEFSQSISATGVVSSSSTQQINAPFTGVVGKVYVEEGQEVKRGDLLFQMALQPVEEELVQAKMEYELLKNSTAAVSSNVTVKQSLISDYIELAQSSGMEYSLFQSAMEQGGAVETGAAASEEEELIQLALKKVELLEDKLESAEVRAGMDGKVNQMLVQEGVAVQSDTMAAVIGGMGDYLITATVNEQEYRYIQEGQPAVIACEAAGDGEWNGTVSAKSSQISRNMATQEDAYGTVKIKPEDFSGILGATTQISIQYHQETGVLLAPLDCLIEEEEKNYVYVINDGSIVEKREIALGNIDGYQMVITQGVEEGATLVRNPQMVKEGGKIGADGGGN